MTKFAEKKRKSTMALLIVRERRDGTIRQRRIKNLSIIAVTVGLAAVIILMATRIINDANNGYQARLDEYESTVAVMSGEISDLERERNELGSKIDLLSETVATKAALEEVREEEQRDNSLPKAFPLGGSGAVAFGDEEDNATVVFLASDGNTVISVGAGIVESVESDEKYGNRLTIDHQNGYKSIYLNSGQPLVKTGEELGKRYILFLVGADNRTLGFGILENEEPIDPMAIMEIPG